MEIYSTRNTQGIHNTVPTHRKSVSVINNENVSTQFQQADFLTIPMRRKNVPISARKLFITCCYALVTVDHGCNYFLDPDWYSF